MTTPVRTLDPVVPGRLALVWDYASKDVMTTQVVVVKLRVGRREHGR